MPILVFIVTLFLVLRLRIMHIYCLYVHNVVMCKRTRDVSRIYMRLIRFSSFRANIMKLFCRCTKVLVSFIHLIREE